MNVCVAYIRCSVALESTACTSVWSASPTRSNVQYFVFIQYFPIGNSDHLQNGLVRLVGGSKESEGRVEVSYDGQWQQVCYYSFDQEDAEVVCRQLGYNMALYQTSTWFDSSVSDGVDIYCFGGESGLNDCTLSKPSDCYSFLRPFIECSSEF